MNTLIQKLLIAAAGVTLLFATGCVKKPVRPIPQDTLISSGQGATYATDGDRPLTSTDNTGFGTQTTPPEFAARPVSQTDGNISGNEMRNVSELQPIFFDFDRSSISKDQYAKVQAVKDYLAKNPQYKVIFEGHCDWRGTAEYNLALGERRANAVRRYALSIGIDAAKIQVRSKGSQQAKEKGTDAEMAHDRRAEIVVLLK